MWAFANCLCHITTEIFIPNNAPLKHAIVTKVANKVFAFNFWATICNTLAHVCFPAFWIRPIVLSKLVVVSSTTNASS